MILLVVLVIVFSLFDIFSHVLVIVIGCGQKALCFVSGLAPLKFSMQQNMQWIIRMISLKGYKYGT